ncbi:MAG: hypothetical protein AAFP13_02355 [Pseudomonadota bacterium]
MRDEIVIENERVKLAAGFVNAIGIGLIGFAILRPLVDFTLLSPLTAVLWGALGLVWHGASHYILGYMRKEALDDVH